MKLKRFWWKIRYQNLLSPNRIYREIVHGVKNLIKWFPVIWNDRDWDQIYFLIILRKKLHNKEKYFARSNPIILNSDRVARQISRTKMAVDRLLADDYHANAFKFHDKKWGELSNSIGNPDEFGRVEWLCSRPNATIPELVELERKESRRLFEHARYLRKQDWEYVTKMIAKYADGWWD